MLICVCKKKKNLNDFYYVFIVIIVYGLNLFLNSKHYFDFISLIHAKVEPFSEDIYT